MRHSGYTATILPLPQVVIFVGEYFLRLRADTWVWMFEPMNMFDTFVVPRKIGSTGWIFRRLCKKWDVLFPFEKGNTWEYCTQGFWVILGGC